MDQNSTKNYQKLTKLHQSPNLSVSDWIFVILVLVLVLGTWYLVLGTWYLVLGTGTGYPVQQS